MNKYLQELNKIILADFLQAYLIFLYNYIESEQSVSRSISSSPLLIKMAEGEAFPELHENTAFFVKFGLQRDKLSYF